MKNKNALTKNQMKAVKGGIGQNQVWLICNFNGTETQEISPCAPCPYCTNGSFVRYAYSGDENRCPCLS